MVAAVTFTFETIKCNVCGVLDQLPLYTVSSTAGLQSHLNRLLIYLMKIFVIYKWFDV